MTPKEADASSVERWDEPNLQGVVKLYAQGVEYQYEHTRSMCLICRWATGWPHLPKLVGAGSIPASLQTFV